MLSRPPHSARLIAAIAVLTAVVWLAAATARAGVEDAIEQQRALLDLVLNEVPKGAVFALVRSNDILVAVDALERAGLHGFGGRRETVAGQAFVSLVSLGPQLTYKFDEAALAIRVTAPPSMLGSVKFDIRNSQRADYTFSRATSAFLNYGVNWFHRSGYTATAEAGLSVAGALATTTYSRNERGELARGLSSVVLDDRSHLRRVVAGDSLVGDRLLGGTVYLGGIRVAREYSVDPYFIQFPTLGLSGAAATPSTVEVYVNGRLVRQERVQPGQFELANIPVPNGASDTRVVVRDAFGREQQIASPYYLTSSVLARGLHEYEYSVGFPRSGVGSFQGGYGRLAAIGRHRYGFANWLTAGFRAEAQEGFASGGPSINLRLPFGEVEGSAAVSQDNGSTGHAAAIGYVYANRAWSVGVNGRSYSAGYSTLSLRESAYRVRSSVTAFVGLPVAGRVGASLQHSFSTTYGGTPVSRSGGVITAQFSQRAVTFARFNRSRENGRWSTEASIGLTVVLGVRSAASLSTSFGEGRTVTDLTLQRSVPVGEGLGYRLEGATGNENTARGRLEYQSRFGRAEAAHDAVGGGQDHTSVAVAGGIVAIGGSVFATRPVQDGYAVVRVPGVKGVRGFLSNQEVGRTNSRGDLLVPNLLSYYANRLAIADQDVPLDHAVDGVERAIAPPYRGGAVVVFGTREEKGVSGTAVIVEEDREVVPEFGELVVVAGDRRVESPIGRGGSFYLENLPAGSYQATVTFEGSSCTVPIVVPSSTAGVVDIGRVRCIAGGR